MAEQPVSVEVSGLDELAAGSILLAERIGEGAGQAFQDVASATADVVAVRVPRVTGRLAGSVQAQFDRASQTASVGMGEGVPYAGWIEFGGGRYSGRPYIAGGRYLTPTAEASGRELEAAGAQAASQEIRRFPWRRPSPL